MDPPAPPSRLTALLRARTIKLSVLDSDDQKLSPDLVESVKTCIRDDGFLFLEDYGISLEQVSASYLTETLADHPAAPTLCNRSVRLCHMSDEDKQRLLFNPEVTVAGLVTSTRTASNAKRQARRL